MIFCIYFVCLYVYYVFVCLLFLGGFIGTHSPANGLLNINSIPTIILASGQQNVNVNSQSIALLSLQPPTITSVIHQDCVTSGNSLINCPLQGGGILTIFGTGFSSGNWLPLTANTICNNNPTRVIGSEDTACICTLKGNSAGARVIVMIIGMTGI